MSKHQKTALVSVSSETMVFDYGALKPAQAEKLRATAKGIQDKINKSLSGLIEAGKGLLAAKTRYRTVNSGRGSKRNLGGVIVQRENSWRLPNSLVPKRN